MVWLSASGRRSADCRVPVAAVVPERSAIRRLPGRGFAPAALTAAASLLVACAGTRGPNTTGVHPAAPGSEAVVGYEVVREPAAAAVVSRSVEVRPATPEGEHRLPAVPPCFDELGLERLWVTVRITIVSDGPVTAVEDSPLETPPPSACVNELRAAVGAAVRDWHFYPAQRFTFADGADLDGDGSPDYRALSERRAIAVYRDVRFTVTRTPTGATVSIAPRD